ncbi:Oligopeptide ABC transporter, periplasmic oligopeptide-binding protein OppA [Euzebya pacifica]|uniref:Oligopeptide ABC transporter, periplasmic oligopeptide-binding protein OppA n=2 Tax=Euzebya pacifica TaxID=1608957 RepID=A0A346XYX4_9ACTN|nr:Oligopeptide ABC transporter, periplasmic oligopeptide-binding protein OppA [Euzebya pacifica]
MRASWLRMLAIIAVLALAAAACGGGESSTEDTADDTASEAEETDAEEPADEADAEDTEEEPADEPTETEDDAAEGEPTGDNTLVFGTTEQPSTIDPADVYEKLASDILFNTTNRLVEFSAETNEIGPGLAESYDISEDGLTYTFNLREGVVFQDGSEMTSEDVVWSINRSLNIAHPDGASFLIGSITSIEAPDDSTVVITISEPNSTFLARLNYTVATVLPSDSDVYTAPDAKLEAPSDDDAGAETLLDEAESYIVSDQIVGTGPYQMTDYQPGVSMTLERFEDYWGEAPAIDTVRIVFYESTTQMRNALAAGEIDMAVNDLDPTETSSLEGEEGIEILTDAGGRTSYMVVDVTQPPFDDPAVRRAVAATIDRQRIVDEAFEGQASPLFSMIPENFDVSADHISDIEVELSTDSPIEFELWYPADRYTNQAEVAEIISRSLNESGLFNVTTNTSEWATEYSTHLNDGAYPIYLLGWYPDYLDPDDYIEPFYHSEKTFIGFYGSEEMDSLITAEQEAEPGTPERAEIFDEIQQLAATDMPFIPLYSEGQEAYFNERVQGVEDTLGAAQQTWFYVLSLS